MTGEVAFVELGVDDVEQGRRFYAVRAAPASRSLTPTGQ
jgi:hypothetical protein